MFVRTDKGEEMWRDIKMLMSEIFKVSLLTYLLFFIIESVVQGFISSFFEINNLLVIVFISGLSTVVFTKDTAHVEKRQIRKIEYIFVLLLSLGAGALVFYQIKDLGIFSYIITLASIAIIILISMIFLRSDDEFTNKDNE